MRKERTNLDIMVDNGFELTTKIMIVVSVVVILLDLIILLGRLQ